MRKIIQSVRDIMGVRDDQGSVKDGIRGIQKRGILEIRID